MDREFVSLRYGNERLTFSIPRTNLLYSVKPGTVPCEAPERELLISSLRNPIASRPLSDQLKTGMKVVVVGDDITRATPRERIFPVLLDELNRAGIPDRDILVLIGLGTHRYMTEKEIERCFGKEVTSRVPVLNHEWKEPQSLIRIGHTPGGTPIDINRLALEADFLIAVGSIVPHCYAGYGGGGKAIQPGISSWETTGKTHIMPMAKDLYLQIAGEVENEVRSEIELVASAVGLRFIVNVVIDEQGKIVKAVSGDLVKAHRAGVAVAQRIYEQPIPDLADTVIVSAYPADIDYWQGIKPLSYAQKGVRKGGISILVAPFPDGLSPTHGEILRKYGTLPYGELKKKVEEGTFDDLVCAATLLLHAKIMEHSSRVICVSEGLSIEDKEALGFQHATTVEEALEVVFREQGQKAKIGVIDCGGDVLPKVV